MNKQKQQFAKYEKLMDDIRKSPEYKIESLKLDIAEEMLEYMERRGVSRAGLADKLGVSKAYITKILTGTSNFTLESLVRIAYALDCELNVRFGEPGFKFRLSSSESAPKYRDVKWKNTKAVTGCFCNGEKEGVA